MLRTLVLSTAAMVLSTIALAMPATADEEPVTDPTPVVVPVLVPSIAVVGDSITAWFRDVPGSASQGWWSMLARDLGATVSTYAEAGSGMNVRGNNCYGTTFGQRLKELRKVDYLIIQGGRNDMFGCDSKGNKKTLSKGQQKAGIARFLARLGDRADALGIPRSRVLVVSPWGKADRARGYTIQSYMRLYSNRKHERFTYVESKTLPTRFTLDNKHPNRAGSLYLASVMKRAVRSVS